MPASDKVLTIPRTGPERAAATTPEGAAPSAFRRVHVPRTKIVGTLGPASNSAEGVRGLIEAGLDVARINFSHGTHEQHAKTIAIVREVAEQLGRPVAILGDLQGPRIRIGVLPEKRELEPGTSVVLVPDPLLCPAAEKCCPSGRRADGAKRLSDSSMTTFMPRA